MRLAERVASWFGFIPAPDPAWLNELNYSLVGHGDDDGFIDIPIPSKFKEAAIGIAGLNKIVPGFRCLRHPITYTQALAIVRLFQGVRCTLGPGYSWAVEGYEEDAATHQRLLFAEVAE